MALICVVQLLIYSFIHFMTWHIASVFDTHQWFEVCQSHTCMKCTPVWNTHLSLMAFVQGYLAAQLQWKTAVFCSMEKMWSDIWNHWKDALIRCSISLSHMTPVNQGPWSALECSFMKCIYNPNIQIKAAQITGIFRFQITFPQIRMCKVL